MNRKSLWVDVLGAAALVGVVGTSVLAQSGGPSPQPVRVQCPGFTVYRFNGELVDIDSWTCPEGMDCYEITIRDSQGRIIGGAGGCVDPQ